MAKRSIITEDMEHCIICGSPYVHCHHVFFGTANRKISDRMGLVVPLCMEHHTGRTGVHFDRQLDLLIKGIGQQVYEKQIGSRDEFIKTFGQSYL